MAAGDTIPQFCSRCGRQRVGDERFCPNDATPYVADTQPQPTVSATNPSPSPAAPPKKKLGFVRTMSIGCLGVAGLIVLLVVLASLAGGGSRGSATPQAGQAASGQNGAAAGGQAAAQPTAAGGRVVRVGERVESAGVAITVNSANRTQSLSQFQQAGQGKTFIVADVTVENAGRDRAPYNPLYFKVKDAGDFEYSGSLVGDDRQLKSGELPRGERVGGTVAFEVPAAATGLVMSYQPLVIFGGYQVIRVSLE